MPKTTKANPEGEATAQEGPRKITKSLLEKEPPLPAGQRKMIRDTEVKGFGVRLTANAMTFFFEHRIRGEKSQVRLSIGNFPGWSVEEARAKARELVVDMDNGIDPRATRKNDSDPTLKDAYEAFLGARTLAPESLRQYKRFFDKHFTSWHKLPLHKITGEMVAKKHIELGKLGKTQANFSIRFLRALMSFAQAKYGEDYLPKNPAKIISSLKQWFPVNKRRNVIKRHEFPKWFQAVDQLRADGRGVYADLMVFLLLTGSRRSEGATLKWSEVDFKERSILFLGTKNGEDRKVPIPDYLLTVLKRRQAESNGSPYVFASNLSSKGHVVSVHDAVETVKKMSEVTFTLHDLRRTYATTLESMDVSIYALKSLLGHKMGADVTGSHYTIIDIERLRGPAQRLEDAILLQAGVIEGNVRQLHKRA